MPASLNKLRQGSDDDISSAYLRRAAAIEENLRAIGVDPSDMPMRPNYHGLTHAGRLQASAKFCQGMAAVASKHSLGCSKLIDELCEAIKRVVKTPFGNIDNETINGLSEVESKKALGLAVMTIFYQAKQIHILAGEGPAGDHLMELFNRQRKMWLQHAEEVEQELLQRSGDVDRISALEEDVAKRSAEVRELRAFMNTLSKKLHGAATGQAKLPKELRKCEKPAMDSSVERIISALQAERDAVKDMQAKLREATAEKQELQLATEQLRDNVKELRRQLNEAVADKVSNEAEIDEIMEKRIRCSVCIDHEKDTVFVCGHAYCSGCASEWRKCTVCVTEKGNRPIT